MNGIYSFIMQYRLLSIILILANILPAILIVKRIRILTGERIIESMGTRNDNLSFYKKCILLVAQSIKDYSKRDKKAGIYLNAKNKMKKAGYTSEFAAIVYLFLKYILTSVIFILTFIINYPYIIRSILISVSFILIIEIVIKAERKKINLKLQKYVYKIYKYLHNQISSGVKATDAIKTVYEVIEDKQLKDVLIRLAARYELTLDIDASLEEFKSNFDLHEAETLCVALKQGIETGDNQELLARQEEVMFKKYFNYIQAETDSCKTRSIIAAAVFTSIVVLMIIIPMLFDITEAVGKIFVI